MNDRCKQITADLIHMFWSCWKLTQIWQSIFNATTAVLHHTLEPSPLIFLGGRSSWCTSKSCSGKFSCLLYLICIIAQMEGAFPSCFTNWIRTLCSHQRWKTINHERIYIRILLDMEALLRLCRWARCSVANWNGQHAVWQQSTFFCFSPYWIIHIVLNFIYLFIYSFHVTCIILNNLPRLAGLARGC